MYDASSSKYIFSTSTSRNKTDFVIIRHCVLYL